MSSILDAQSLASLLNRHLVFIHGKGGVGKTVVSKAIAIGLAEKGRKTLWVTVEDPTLPKGQISQISPSLSHLNCDFTLAFEEYIALKLEGKLGGGPLTRLFLQNKLIRYLARAAPGIHELVLLGKIWFERLHYDHVIIDLPSTGYGLAMFQSTENFRRLFHGGPLQRDAEAMMNTFSDAEATGHLILALPEEMPLLEALELNDYLTQILPKNRAGFIVNRVFPATCPTPEPTRKNNETPGSPDRDKESRWVESPLADTESEYIQKRCELEGYNLRIWREQKIKFGQLEYVPPSPSPSMEAITRPLARQLLRKAYI